MAQLLNTSVTGSLIIGEYIKLEELYIAPSTGSNKVQMWFDASDLSVKVQYYGETITNIWGIAALGSALNSARAMVGSAGVVNSAVAFGGCTLVPGTVATQATEEYNGTSWSSVNDMLVCRLGIGGAGTQICSVAIGGERINIACNNTEEYNGTSWATGGTLNTTRTRVGAAGSTMDVSVAYMGVNLSSPSPYVCSNTEEYNGTSWTSVNNVNTGRGFTGHTGTQNTAMAVGGEITAPSFTVCPCTELYDGATWAVDAELLASRSRGGLVGTQNAALYTMGLVISPTPSVVANTETYNGITWSTACNAPTTFQLFAATGCTIECGLFAGGTLGDFSSVFPTTSVPCYCESSMEGYVIKNWNFE